MTNENNSLVNNYALLQDNVHNAIVEAGIKSGDIIFIHSDVNPIICAPEFELTTKGLVFLKNCILNILGKEGTLIFPTFNYDFCKGKPFNVQKSLSQVGGLTNYCLKSEEFKRSNHPIFSFAITGKETDYFINDLSNSSFGAGSIFHKLHCKNAKLVFFNVNFSFCTYIHYVEQDVGVDYRFLKEFSGKIIDCENEYDYTTDYYARYLDRNIISDMTLLEKDLLFDGRMKKSIFKSDQGQHQILQVHCDDIYREATMQLKQFPYYLLKHPPRLPEESNC